MELSEFVSSTITQVMEAVANAQNRGRELGGYVNPTATHIHQDAQRLGSTASGQVIYAIDFDVAVTVSDETGGEGGAKLQVASLLSIGDKVRASDKSETISRVRFSIPITYPVDADSAEERKQLEERKATVRRDAGKIQGRSDWMSG